MEPLNVDCSKQFFFLTLAGPNISKSHVFGWPNIIERISNELPWRGFLRINSKFRELTKIFIKPAAILSRISC